MTMLEKIGVVRLFQKYRRDVSDKLFEVIVDKHNSKCDSIDFFWVGDTNIHVTYKWKCCGVYTMDTVDIPIALLVDNREVQNDNIYN